MRKTFVTALASLAALWLATQSAAAQETAAPDEEPALKAFSAWNAQGQIFQSGENRVTFVGSFS
ncbi:MAG TPA: hypothetical protein VEC60_19255, partial [Reyranella sp.]|nr:hypothetical protein [Reyranella sp.]